MHLPRDLSEFIRSLNSRSVEYLVVGGYALAFYGTPRFTGDIDFLVRPSAENAARLERALADFGFTALGLSATDFLEPGQMIQLGYPPNRIDLLTSLTGVDFDEAWGERVAGEIDGLPVMFIGRAALVKNKRAVGRPQDLADLHALGAS
jgi:hypothetical protein